ncbi:MAG: mannitol dehydrogenase family protein [Acetobacteraceae bacterium]|nr:mannitol dehydrogenase family protein [Acetobacteraceae bacterium]
MSARLSNATLRDLPADVARPAYDRAALGHGIVHLGLGAFHRAHQAAYTDAIIAAGDTRWGITAASLRSPDTRDALAPQDCLYALEQRSQTGQIAVIGSITDIIVAPEAPAALIARMAHPQTAIVSLTVTEKAYCRDPASGALDEADASIRHDLANPQAPRSVFGFLAAAIAARRAAGLAPFTVLCCDNLPCNGQTVHSLLLRFASLRDADLAAYVAGEIACPDTMVDRIVPATTDTDRARIATRLGVQDAWPVVAEPFTQWVIEDRFTAGRPAWENAGATLTHNVAPFEAMKLRLLNGSHSAIAYLGYLAGHETVADAMGDAAIAAFVATLMDRTTPTVALPDLDRYKASLLDRFRNPALRHRTWQIAMDGSQKLPQRILGPVRDLLARDLPIDCHALTIAAWMRYVAGMDERGQPIDVRDPMAAELARIAASTGPQPERLAPALLNVSAIFGDLCTHPVLGEAVAQALACLTQDGARRAAAAYAG